MLYALLSTVCFSFLSDVLASVVFQVPADDGHQGQPSLLYLAPLSISWTVESFGLLSELPMPRKKDPDFIGIILNWGIFFPHPTPSLAYAAVV